MAASLSSVCLSRCHLKLKHETLRVFVAQQRGGARRCSAVGVVERWEVLNQGASEPCGPAAATSPNYEGSNVITAERLQSPSGVIKHRGD